MLKHYLIVAIRNLLKYKNQTVISIAGLAVGFTCFSLSALWIRYEMSFDTFLPDVERIYVIKTEDLHFRGNNSSTRNSQYPLAGYLKATFPEIEAVTSAGGGFFGNNKLTVNGIEIEVKSIMVDSAFFDMFGVKFIRGSYDFLIPNSNKVAVTQQKARQIWGDDDPLGKEFELNKQKHTVCAVVSDMSKRSNYFFDFLQPFYEKAFIEPDNWRNSYGENTIVRLRKGVDVEAFEKKLYEHEYKRDDDRTIDSKLKFTPITLVRYEDRIAGIGDSNIRFNQIVLFAVAGLLVILCTMFNYLSLFISRIRVRQKEFALRIVNGATGRSLFALLTVEFIISLLAAVLLQLALTDIILQPFMKISSIDLDLIEIYPETLLYIAVVIIVLLLGFQLTVSIIRKRTVNVSVRRSGQGLFRKISVVVQLIISIGFAFFTLMMIKQLYYLHNIADLGFEFKDRGSLTIYSNDLDKSAMDNKISLIPEITQSFRALPILPVFTSKTLSSSSRGGSIENNITDIEMRYEEITKEYFEFYELEIVKGKMPAECAVQFNPKTGDNEIIKDYNIELLINEAAAKEFGWDDLNGKRLFYNTVTGVIADMCLHTPTMAAKPTFYKIVSHPTMSEKTYDGRGFYSCVFKYHPGSWKTVKDKITDLVNSEIPDNKDFSVRKTEDEYDKYLKSENALLTLLTFISIVCVLICIFGFVSIVSLTCEERRKEIAIRKINGATVHDILGIFFRENFILLLIGAAIAFPIGYYIMRGWLEQYVRQTDIGVVIYPAILFAMALVIVLCVGWRVLKTSRENPANVVKSE
jgi:hypothetical protein